MTSKTRNLLSVFSCAFAIGLFSLANAGPGRAQAPTAKSDSSATEDKAPNSTAAPDPMATDQPLAVGGNASAKDATPQSTSSAAGSDWHLSISPYLWFPGVHGTVGTTNRQASIHASAGDLLSNFRFGLMGEADLRYKRILLPIDMMWVRLGDNKALPGPNLLVNSVDVKAWEFLLTPKVGYRLIDQEKFKVDALTGFRYWHVGQSLQFNPSQTGLNFSSSLNWVDPLVGGRIQMALSPKAIVGIGGDVGGWGAGSQLDYQVAGLLGYRIKPTWTLLAGYRYLDVNYRSGGKVFDVATSGVVFGVNIVLK